MFKHWQHYVLKYFPDLDVMYLPNTPLQRWEFADSRLVRSVGSSGTCSKQTRTASNKLQLVLGSLELHWNKKYSIAIFNLIANDKNSWRHFGWISKKNINYLLWGLLGTNIGSTPPTTPKIAVKRITGKSANPMMTLYDLYPSKFSQSAKLWYPEPKFRCGYWDPLMNFIFTAHVQTVS